MLCYKPRDVMFMVLILMSRKAKKEKHKKEEQLCVLYILTLVDSICKKCWLLQLAYTYNFTTNVSILQDCCNNKKTLDLGCNITDLFIATLEFV